MCGRFMAFTTRPTCRSFDIASTATFFAGFHRFEQSISALNIDSLRFMQVPRESELRELQFFTFPLMIYNLANF
jgi:hypothetical protein